jgi:hypothetical protein
LNSKYLVEKKRISTTNIAQVDNVKVTFPEYINKGLKKPIKPSANIKSAYMKHSIDDPNIECSHAIIYICLKQSFENRIESGVIGKIPISFLSFYLLSIRYRPGIYGKVCLNSEKVDVTNTPPEQLIIIFIPIRIDYSKMKEIDL